MLHFVLPMLGACVFVQAPPTEEAPPPKFELCPLGWTAFGDSCYLVDDSPVHWETAEASCQQRGAHLASVHSTAEQEFLEELTTAAGVQPDSSSAPFCPWFGAAAGDEVTYQYSDGTPVDYTNWNDGEPNNAGGVEHCAYLCNAYWKDARCNTQTASICKMPKGSPLFEQRCEVAAEDAEYICPGGQRCIPDNLACITSIESEFACDEEDGWCAPIPHWIETYPLDLLRS